MAWLCCDGITICCILAVVKLSTDSDCCTVATWPVVVCCVSYVASGCVLCVLLYCSYVASGCVLCELLGQWLCVVCVRC